MGIVQIPQHMHVNENGSICQTSTVILPEIIHGSPMAPEAMMTRLQHIPMVLIPIVGLIYAGVFYRRYVQARAAFKEVNDFTPNTKCPQCRETARIMRLPIIISVLGGLGFMLPLLILLIPILLIVGLSKAIFGISKGIAAGIKYCSTRKLDNVDT
ncbi:hypothetical protein C834K_0358 [Chlamydia poikilotherma]|uniref:Uncharacterized protein n=1 Tax=Chlamydia poikilotherma TaxID=1967783 RepID=A0A3B0PS46_9CHLA|nr:hypothetical protein [Chlamydia poikilotherma]SYX08821.1 hypothetical protein C834K_0358 [Chlamydia poikilotherma]